MRSSVNNSRDSGRSGISCLSCRRRKVKCDRTVPECLVCEQTSQSCTYPSSTLKPGPKIGSRKRTREVESGDNGNDDTRRRTSASRLAPVESEITSQEILATSSPKEASPEVNQTSTSSTAHTQEKVAAETSDRIRDLSFILHPSHETSSPDNNERTSNGRRTSTNTQGQHGAIDRACSALGLKQMILQQLIKTYFDNMTAINLFHEPTFREKLAGIASSTQLSALLAAMLAFAVRFYSDGQSTASQADKNQRAAQFMDIAQRCNDEALRECSDSAPPLCVLQASIIATHCQLSQGVLGRAWRSLGTCVRLAYEMNLHLVDARGPRSDDTVDIDQWCDDEEKRRAWWAIWEMDVFATTIRRTPTAVDWSQIETLLPVEDEHWFQRKPRASCFLERDPISRWEALENSGNQAPKAWFIVINSLMKDARQISSPRGVPSLSPPDDRQTLQPPKMDEARQTLETIANAVQCFRLALPNHLKYHGQYLGFDARVPGQYSSLRQTHCSIYNIHMMTQLARLMIYRYDVFKGQYRVALSTHDSSVPSTPSRDGTRQVNKSNVESLAIEQYFQAADDMLAIVNRCSEDHIQHINPFLSNTIWLASAVHLLRSQFCRPGTNKAVVKSRFKVMHLTYKKCVRFWDIHTAVQQNLGSLEEQLEACQRPDGSQENSTDRQRPITGESEATNQGREDTPASRNPRANSHSAAGFVAESPTSYPQNTSDMNTTQPENQPAATLFPTPPSSHSFYPTDWQSKAAGPQSRTPNPNPAMLDFTQQLSPTQTDNSFHTRPSIPDDNHIHAPSSSSATLIDPMLFIGAHQPGGLLDSSRPSDTFEPNDWNWSYPRLPSDLQDMLSGFFTA